MTTGPYVDKVATFSRDGGSLYFNSDRSGTWEIWKIPATGGNAVQITSKGEGGEHPQESPDGRFLYYRKGAGVWRMPVGGGEESMVLDSVHGSGGRAFWDQGIYFFRPPDAKGHSDICLYQFATGKTTKILTIEKPVTYFMDASSDGRTILYVQHDQDGSDLMLVENFR